MLRCEGITVSYSNLDAVKDVDLLIETSTTVGVVGPNGAGKTSLLRGICGLERVRAGEVWLDDAEVTGTPAPDLVRRGVSLVPAGRQLFANLTVEKNLWLGAHIHTGSQAGRKQADQQLDEVFQLFPILKERRRQLAGSLSGGEQQMVAIGRAMMARPRLLVLDEPSLGLAPIVLGQIFSALKRLVTQSQIAVLLVEQNAELTSNFVDRIYLLDSGRVVKSGSVTELGRDDIARSYMGGVE